MLVNGRVGRIEEHLLHHTYSSFPQYLEKFGRYTTWAANDLQKRGKRATPLNLTLRPAWRFVRQYVWERGFLDGTHGLILCALAAFSVFMKYAKLWDMHRSARRQVGQGDERAHAASDAGQRAPRAGRAPR